MHQESSRPEGALQGLRVIEMGQLIAGPFCGQLMADFGAEVIKLEPPGKGDPMREWGHEKPQGLSLWWPVIARGKKSVEIDARQAAGQALIRDLAATSDVLIENFRPGTMEKWGLGYDALAAVNPRLVMIRVSPATARLAPMRTRPGSARSARRWAGCATSSATPARRPAAWASRSATPWRRPSPASAA